MISIVKENYKLLKYVLFALMLLVLTSYCNSVEASTNDHGKEDQDSEVIVFLNHNTTNRRFFVYISEIVEPSEQISKELKVKSIKVVPASYYKNISVANVDSYLNVRKSNSTNSIVIGKMTVGTKCTVLNNEGEWSKIKSGSVEGYVKSEYLVTGKKAYKAAKKYGKKEVQTTKKVKLYAKKDMSSKVICTIKKGTGIKVLKEYDNCVKIKYKGKKGYVKKTALQIVYKLSNAKSIESSTGVSEIRYEFVAYAKQFLGRPYVYGGTSLTNGIDCSAYVQAIYSHFGYTIPRTSWLQATQGKEVSLRDLKPGDLVFYSRDELPIGHVGMYIGNGQIIHASCPKVGVTISNMYYKQPVKAISLLR